MATITISHENTPNDESENIEKEYKIFSSSNKKTFKIKIRKGKMSIIFNAQEIGDIKETLFRDEEGFKNFEKLDRYFRQFDTIDELFEDIIKRENNELKVEEVSNNIKLILYYEIRKEKKGISFILKPEKSDSNKILMNLCEKSKEIDILKKENITLKNKIAELQFLVSRIYNSNIMDRPYCPKEIYTENWIEDSKKIDWKLLDPNKERYYDGRDGRIKCTIF